MAQTEVSWGHIGSLSVLLGSGVGCLVCFCYKGLGSHFLSAALGTFKYSGECFKFLLMAAIELFLANLSIKVGQGWMNGILSWLKDLDASVWCHKSTVASLSGCFAG